METAGAVLKRTGIDSQRSVLSGPCRWTAAAGVGVNSGGDRAPVQGLGTRQILSVRCPSRGSLDRGEAIFAMCTPSFVRNEPSSAWRYIAKAKGLGSLAMGRGERQAASYVWRFLRGQVALSNRRL